MMLIWEVFDSAEAALLYPVNSLRNYARMQVGFALITMFDLSVIFTFLYSPS